MHGIIITCHGRLASGANSALNLVAGECKNIRTVDFEVGMGFDEIDQDLIEARSSLSNQGYTTFLYLTDLAGGTPFNRSVLLTENDPNSRVLAGINFAMLYQAAFSDGTLEESRLEAMEAASESIVAFELPAQAHEDEDEDGI